ncbi:MAG: glycoside hydrolase family 95 protein [Planctomycetaceae bacterium]|nr:glycoside hydrolase family 95 protein [Planctomycetaceae bacterium]
MNLWYSTPGDSFFSALPIGNGRLGAMIYGNPACEHLGLNEETLWSGGPHQNLNPAAAEALPRVRELIFAGEYAAAERLIASDMMGRPGMMQSYQPMGDLTLAFAGHEDATDYRRELDLDQALARVSYCVDGVRYTREMFASHPANIIVVRLECDQSGALSFDVTLACPHPHVSFEAAGATLRMIGQIGPTPDPDSNAWTAPWHGPGVKFESRVIVAAEGGTITAAGGVLQVRGASAVTLRLAAATSFVRYDDISGDPAAACEAHLATAAGQSYDELRRNHVEDFGRLYTRCSLDLGRSPLETWPTDQRIGKMETADPQLAAVYFAFGRYVLISCSRPGTRAATLQGIWNEAFWPFWGSKYTININIQMAYWPAEVTNLGECHGPLFDMLDDLAVTGAANARQYYGAGGWMTHHNTDQWRLTAPVDGVGTYWQTGGAWLATHLFEHYLFTQDRKFLRDRAWPLMEGAAQFFVDSLVEIPAHLPLAGRLVTCPSSSPEHGPPTGEAQGCRIAYGPTIDLEIVAHLLGQCIEAAEILGTDPDFAATLRRTLERLAPLQIGKHGQLQEWIGDWDDPARNHHHVSHMYGLFPAAMLTPDVDPRLAAAAKVSLTHRKMLAGGWIGIWRTLLWARLKDAPAAWEYLCANDHRMSSKNLWDGCRQIDCVCGVAAAIAEMLLQSHAGVIELLPALPAAWPTGSVKGLCARGGFEVDIAWSAGKLTAATIRSRNGGRAIVRYAGKDTQVDIAPGREQVVR